VVDPVEPGRDDRYACGEPANDLPVKIRINAVVPLYGTFVHDRYFMSCPRNSHDPLLGDGGTMKKAATTTAIPPYKYTNPLGFPDITKSPWDSFSENGIDTSSHPTAATITATRERSSLPAPTQTPNSTNSQNIAETGTTPTAHAACVNPPTIPITSPSTKSMP
jgi:hypothetical protein